MPESVVNIIDQNMLFFIAINKYVYNGGIIVIAAYNHENANATIIFMNEILRVVYSQIRFRVDGNLKISKINDSKFNYLANSNLPMFFDIKQLEENVKIDSIYLRNPIEFFAQGEALVNKSYNIEHLVIFNETTILDSHLVKNSKDYSSVILSNFGLGKIVVMSGINFSDYDIDNLDKKKWLISLFKYISKDKKKTDGFLGRGISHPSV